MALSPRWPLLALPVATVVVVALGLVTGGALRPYRTARVWGGPTGGARVSTRVEVLEVLEERGAVHEAPVPSGSVSVRLHAPGFDAVRSAPLDVEGGAEFTFEPPPGAAPLELTVSSEAGELARGKIALDAAPWARVARRRGPPATARAGDYDIRVALGRGALAVPFEEDLLVFVEQKGVPAPGVSLRASATGARVMPPSSVTDATGRAVLRVAPSEHAVSFNFELDVPSGTERASFAFPVAAGAMRATRHGDTLLIEAPVPRDVAYFALVTPSERLFGGRALLRTDAEGRTTARIPLPPLPAGPLYAVVSSERDLRSAAAVGWPLDAKPGEPALTFDAVDALLLDGRPRIAEREAHRRTRVRFIVGAFSAAALTIELLLLVAFTRKSDRSLDAHLEGAGLDAEAALRLAPKRSPAVLIALIAIALGFVVVALAGVLRIE